MDGCRERRKKKISLFAKLVISVSFVPVLRCLWMNWGKWLENTTKQRASQPASLLGNFKPPLQRRLGFSSKGHVFGITALPSHPFSNLEQHRGDWKWDGEQLGAWELSNYRLNLLLTLAWPQHILIEHLGRGISLWTGCSLHLREPCLGETLPYNQHIPKMLRLTMGCCGWPQEENCYLCTHFCCSQSQLVLPSAFASGPSVMSNVNQLFQAAALHLAHEKSAGCWLDEWVWWLSRLCS